MKNMEQIRARNANHFAKSGSVKGKEGGEVIKKIPPMILNHGLLATAAYSYNNTAEGWIKTFDAIAAHLSDSDIGVLPSGTSDREKMMDFLTGESATSETLKLATEETMAWLGYASRFVKKD